MTRTILATAACLAGLWLLSSHAPTANSAGAAPAPPEKKEGLTAEAMARRLAERVTIDKPVEGTLADALDYFTEKFGLRFQIDPFLLKRAENAGGAACDGQQQFEGQPVKLAKA